MDRFLRRATLVVLLFLAALVWFERPLLGEERGAVRLVVGVLCIYAAVQSIERERLAGTFRQVLRAFQDFRAGAPAEPVQAAPSPTEKRQAVEILVAALRRGGSAAEIAHGNLVRITGQDHGHDADAWQRWLDAWRP